MQIAQILTVSRCRAQVDCASKKRALELAAEIIAGDIPSLRADDVFRQLLNRERLGSTGLGQGIAIPHCRVDQCHSAVGCLITLDNAIDFESVDNQPVSLLFTLVVPQEANDAHVHMLAELVKVFNNPDSVRQLLSTSDDGALHQQALTLFGNL